MLLLSRCLAAVSLVAPGESAHRSFTVAASCAAARCFFAPAGQLDPLCTYWRNVQYTDHNLWSATQRRLQGRMAPSTVHGRGRTMLRAGILLLAAATCCRAQQPTFNKTTVVENPNDPWDVAVSEAGDILYSEKCTGLAIQANRTNGRGYADPVLLFGDPSEGPTLDAPDFFCEGQSGAAGVAFDPDFGSGNRFIYFMFPSSETRGTGRPWNHVARFNLSQGLDSVSNRVDIINDIYFKYEATPNGGAGSHSGGRIRFGPDGYLWVTTGDNHNSTLPQVRCWNVAGQPQLLLPQGGGTLAMAVLPSCQRSASDSWYVLRSMQHACSATRQPRPLHA